VKVPSFFSDFLSEIRPTDSQLQDAKTGHETLRTRLENDENLSGLLVSTFLQGSYRRATAIRPTGEQRSDVGAGKGITDESMMGLMDLFSPAAAPSSGAQPADKWMEQQIKPATLVDHLLVWHSHRLLCHEEGWPVFRLDEHCYFCQLKLQRFRH
jgi:hypothetical protein